MQRLRRWPGWMQQCSRWAVTAPTAPPMLPAAMWMVTPSPTAKGWNVFDTLQNNDAYHALKAVDGLIITGATGTNVNDVAVALVGEK